MACVTAQPSISFLLGLGGIRVAWSDGPESWVVFPLPQRRTLLPAFFMGLLCAVFAIPWIGSIRELIGHDTSSVGELTKLQFEGSGVLIWSLAVLPLFLCTLALVLYRDDIRCGGGKLAYVSRFGPLRILREYELGRIGQVRAGNASPQGLWNICLDYDGATAPFGRGLAPGPLARALDFIRQALESGASGAPAPPKEVEPDAVKLPDPGLASVRPPGPLPLIFLVCANLVPLLGVLFFGWDLAQIMLLFWAENAVIGCYALLKLAIIQRWGVLLSWPLFIGHFGGFMAIHFLFVYHVFVRGAAADAEPDIPTTLVTLFAPLRSAIAAMFVSHGVSFVANFLGRREYFGRTGLLQMIEPYRRVLVLHAALILGGLAVMALDQPVYALVILVAIKIAIDVRAHLHERRRASGSIR